MLGSTTQIWRVLQTLELDPGNTVSVAKVARLEPVVAERREKMKDEMIGAVQGLLDFRCSLVTSRPLRMANGSDVLSKLACWTAHSCTCVGNGRLYPAGL